ncbi:MULTISPECIES: CHASE domain-containing protein [unclassified Pseudomonas]|uniref:CHASE domain-containing hybrid sensor histidine kinase/response regulator n=1 Tax=unclassified Pseudomonas TaxID=196821 RepID=UPI000BDD75FF|nr:MULTISPECIES: CHASE domain-containing protein [unclassified Pseudomonas]PVZ20684.1 PAS domain S-box-containing protein [Pseudomonas sp. URIL14HWK12:I12]PVZ27750.1 PAS domain S-box-containing protein [Pseudomonas sp. URIL14HWK12:I10]PVZ38639.1 PAS domain S-box-containing protein [Pseudomonas sp. URIL14HWK12:I11]SNZ02556.1 PAS domain S-box-containing protein [Pseudomonas sp. URIL14HWK12:I9]
MKASSSGNTILWMAVILITGIVASWVAAREQSDAIDRHVEQALKEASRKIEGDLLARLRVYEYRLRGMRGAVHMLDIDNVSTTLMRRYSRARNLAKEYPGARGFGFIRRVPVSEQAKFVSQIREGGQEKFSVTQFEKHDGERFIIQFIDPAERNAQAIGLDIASEATRRTAAIGSMRSGEATLTAPITLLQDSGQKLSSFLFLLPVYSTPEMPSPDHREAATIGWTYAPLTMREVMGNLNLEDHRLHLKLYDVNTDSGQLIFESEESGPDSTVVHSYTFDREVYGRTWRFEVGVHPLFVTSVDPTPPGRYFLIGLVASILLTGLVGTLLVARQRKQQVAAGQARLATIVENSSDAIIGEALDGRIITWNRAAQTMFGYTEAEVLGQPLAPLLVPASRFSEDQELLERISRGERGSALETQRLHKDGHLIDVTITCSFIREADGTILGAAKMMHDISDSKRVQRYLMEFNAELEQQVSERTAELSRVASLLQAVLDASSEVSIIATDNQGKVIVFNRGAALLLGFSAEETIGQRYAVDFHLRDEVEARGHELTREYGYPIQGLDVFRHKAYLEGSETREWVYLRKDGSHVPVSMIVTPIRTENGLINGYLGIAQDITERLRNSQELQRAKAQAESANAAKSLFLANMSHEIRTPMNAVIGVAHLLQNTHLDDQQRSLLTKLQIAGRSLLGIINDILDIAKIEAGGMKLENAPFSPTQQIEELVELFKPQAEAKGLQFNVEIQSVLPNRVMGDALRVNQILMNLLGNALKFTTSGSVTITVRYEPEAHYKCWLRVVVADTGCGIAADVTEHLFSPFTQADTSITRRFGGTGLGLSVVRGLAEQMGGSVGVTSQLGIGSQFRVDLPLQLANEGAEQLRSDQALYVLLLNEQAEEHQPLTQACHALGWQLTVVQTPTALMTHLQERQRPDLLLISWPEAQALGPVLQRCGDWHLPVVLICSPATPSSIACAGLEHSMKHLLKRPFDASALFNAVNEALAEQPGGAERVNLSSRLDTSVARWLEGLNVLLVDDSDINLEVASLLLMQQGATVQTCSNGLQALECLRLHPATFDAVLMDVQMPEMDGYEATQRLREELGLRDLPVIAVTAGAMAEERHLAQASGMDDFLTKPLEPSIMIRALRRAVEGRRGAPLRSVPILKTGPGDESWPSILGLDSAEASKRLGHDSSLLRSSLKRLFEDFVEFSDDRLLKWPTSLSGADLQARLHKLRGTAALLGAKALAKLAQEAEELLRHGAQQAHLSTALEPLLAAYAALDRQTLEFRESVLALPKGNGDNGAARQALLTLHDQLRNQDMAASDTFAIAIDALREVADEALLTLLWQAIDNLDYARAQALLEQATATLEED